MANHTKNIRIFELNGTQILFVFVFVTFPRSVGNFLGIQIFMDICSVNYWASNFWTNLELCGPILTNVDLFQG